MGSFENLNIDNINIWTDNPRTGRVMSERNAINTLIDVVGEKKMINLAKDIQQYGLSPVELPVIVNENGNNNVYDGNRRLTCLKIWKHPELVDNERIKEKFSEILNDGSGLIPSTIRVYVTNKNEALQLMDRAHSGEQEGVGRISWNSYQRDISLIQRGLTPFYPISYFVSTNLNMIRESDFNGYPKYTDIERIFGSPAIKNFLGITEYKDLTEEEINKIKNLMRDLKIYKTEKRFNSFSREFNSTSGENIDKLILWLNSRNERTNGMNIPTNDDNPSTNSNGNNNTGTNTNTGTNNQRDNDNHNSNPTNNDNGDGMGNNVGDTENNANIGDDDITGDTYYLSDSQVAPNQSLRIFIFNKLSVTKTIFQRDVDFKIQKLIYEIERLSKSTNRTDYLYSYAIVSLWRTLIEVITHNVIKADNPTRTFSASDNLDGAVTNVSNFFNLRNQQNSVFTEANDPYYSIRVYYTDNNNHNRLRSNIVDANSSIHDGTGVMTSSEIYAVFENSLPYIVTCITYLIKKRQANI